MTIPPDVLKRRISEGVLAFPVTPFRPDLSLDLGAFEAHIAHLAGFRPTALVPAGGAGELFSLTPDEQDVLVRAAVAAAAGIPVIAGVGQGVGMATERARAAERAGADAVLLFPPYLVAAEQAGLAAHLEAVCRTVDIPVIVYSRNNGVLAPDTALAVAERCPNFIGLKDGTGDFEALVSLRARAGDRLALVNGVPTAEIIAAQCFAAGVRSYTSAVFSFLPEFALGYFAAVRDGRLSEVGRLLAEFYVPLTAIRNRRRGYAVSIVKAGLRLVGRPAGPLRPPLLDLDANDERDLAVLIDGALRAAAPPARVAAELAG